MPLLSDASCKFKDPFDEAYLFNVPINPDMEKIASTGPSFCDSKSILSIFIAHLIHKLHS